MSFMNSVERTVRFLGKDIVPPQAKRQLWYYYMTAKRYAITRSLDLPAIVLLEVNTDCNRACSYCSNAVFPKSRQLMERDVFEKAIDDLSGVGVNTWIITQHGDNIPKPLRQLLDSLSPDENKHVTFQTIWQNKLFNRTIPGIIPAEQRAIQDPCFTASFHLQVLVDGSVPQCCMGFAGENIYGNVKDKNLIDIWMDPEFRAHRDDVGHRKFTLDVCKRCVDDKPTVTPIQFFEGYQFSKPVEKTYIPNGQSNT